VVCSCSLVFSSCSFPGPSVSCVSPILAVYRRCCCMRCCKVLYLPLTSEWYSVSRWHFIKMLGLHLALTKVWALLLSFEDFKPEGTYTASRRNFLFCPLFSLSSAGFSGPPSAFGCLSLFVDIRHCALFSVGFAVSFAVNLSLRLYSSSGELARSKSQDEVFS